MVNVEQLEAARQGRDAWNRWRAKHPVVQPDLQGADLAGAGLFEGNLAGANLRGANLRMANLRGADLRRADLGGTNLYKADLIAANLGEAVVRGANLFEASLHGAQLWEADLRAADLSWADLSGANLQRANLEGALFGEADLRGADLRGARLRGAQLAGARVGLTIFDQVDLSQAIGLEALRQFGPSTVGIDTLYRSGGRLPEAFLRGAGVPEEFIAYLRSLGGRPLAYRSCFISYAAKDGEFAERLAAGLEAHNVRCWRDPHSVRIGDRIRVALDEAVRAHDTLCLVLSVHSTLSRWLGQEVEGALDAERRRPGHPLLYPLRLDDSVLEAGPAWAAALRQSRPIVDFTRWREPDAFATALAQLLGALQAG